MSVAAADSPSATGADETSRANSREEARQFLLGGLHRELESHGADLSEHGRNLAPRIAEFRWNPEARRFGCAVDGKQIDLDLPFAFGDPFGARCECAERNGNSARCAHTWAALRRLADLLGHPDEDPLLDEVFELEATPAWSRTLDALDDFLDRQGLGPKNAVGLEVEPEHRLAWRVKVSEYGVGLAAWEQRVSRQDGEWTNGRRVGWERLRTAPELWTCEADRNAAAAVREEHVEAWNGHRDPVWAFEIDVFAALRALAGHPLVFAEDAARQVRVEEVSLGLLVTPAAGGLSLDAALGDRPLARFASHRLHEDELQRGLIGYFENGAEGTDHLYVAPADPRVLQFVRTLEGRARLVPPQGQDELLRRLAQLETLMPVHLPPELVGDPVPADRRVYLRFTPLQPAGLTLQVRVRPAPQGFYCRPGEGAVRLTGVAEGRRVRAERDLDGEREIAAAVVRELSLDAWPEERPWQWRLSDDDEALDLILAVQERIAASPDTQEDVVIEWPAGGQRRVVARLEPASLRVEVESRGDWFSLKGAVEVDGWRLALLALLKALKSGRRYVRLGSGEDWGEITAGFRERLQVLDDVVHQKGQRLEVDATGVPLLQEWVEEDVTLIANRRFRDLLERLEAAGNEAFEPPPGLDANLRPYQLEGYRWMRRLAVWGVGGCLADDMGLGKTVQTLAMLQSRAELGAALVVAPTSLGFNWQREAARFTPDLEVKLLRGGDRRSVIESLGPGRVVVVSYGLVVREIELLTSVRWTTLVLDEAQAIKNSHTKTSQAIRKLEADWFLALSGTPIENHLGELWSLFRSLSPGLFGSWKRFRERFAAPIEKEEDGDRRRALSMLVRPFILRRTKTEVLDELPGRTEVDLFAELSSTERGLYEETRMKALMRLVGAEQDEREQRFQVLAALTRLRQLACHPALVDSSWKKSSAKLDLFLEILAELRDGEHRALVFSQFTQHLDILRRALEELGVSYQYLDGQTSVKERAARVDAFQAGEGDVFLISLMAGGTGLNLTAADYVIHMDPWWNPAVEDQATDRAHRMGQQRPVTVYRLVTRGTIEEEILRLHADKRGLMAGVLEGTDRAGKLTTEELVALVRAGGEEEDV